MGTELIEGFAGERADFGRVLLALEKIDRADMAELRSSDWMAGLIREVGLVPIPHAEITYGPDIEHVNGSAQGLIQIPDEYARFLVFLSGFAIARYMEIGTANGAAACIAAAYLRRFNPGVRCLTADVQPGFIFYPLVRGRIPLEYRVGQTSFGYADEPPFDAVFIDGDHSFYWALADYENVGRKARVCAFHDVNNEPYCHLELGGVPAVWEALKRAEPYSRFEEIFAHPTRQPVMGIGIRVLPDDIPEAPSLAAGFTPGNRG